MLKKEELYGNWHRWSHLRRRRCSSKWKVDRKPVLTGLELMNNFKTIIGIVIKWINSKKIKTGSCHGELVISHQQSSFFRPWDIDGSGYLNVSDNAAAAASTLFYLIYKALKTSPLGIMRWQFIHICWEQMHRVLESGICPFVFAFPTIHVNPALLEFSESVGLSESAAFVF